MTPTTYLKTSEFVASLELTGLSYWTKYSGIEESFQANHLSHFLLTLLLLPIVAPHGRIVNVSSDVHYAGGLNPTDIDHSSIL